VTADGPFGPLAALPVGTDHVRVVHRGVASPRRLAVTCALALALPAVLVLGATGQPGRAEGSQVPRCEWFAADSAQRAANPTGAGPPVLVIGDSWSVGLGLRRPVDSWPSRLPGRVSVAGFSGSGFSATASPCGRQVAFDRRAAAAPHRAGGLVVVQGGLNDVDRTGAAIRAGFARLARVLEPAIVDGRVVVVGPASAPSRAAGVPRVDRLLRDLAERHGIAYVGTSDLALPYLRDGLHLTVAGHRAYGDAVAARIRALDRLRVELPAA
jgi:acyl-CoA thioesterase-1